MYQIMDSIMKETEGSGRWDVSTVFIRPDGSYLIRRLDIVCGNALYHVPNEGKWKGMFDVLTDYVSEHPETLRDIPVHTPTLEEVKTAKLSEINAAADRAIATLTATYPDREISTFDKQESEARAYAADPTASTPLLSALAKARGLELAELVRRVLIKADAFAVASGSIIGQRQALEDQLDACETLEEVDALDVVIIMPGAEVEA